MKEKIISLLQKATKLKKDKISNLIEIPPDPKLGDYAFPTFILAKTLKRSPPEIAQSLASKIKLPKKIEKVQATGSYINFFINPIFLAETTLTEIQEQKDKYGSQNSGKNKVIAIDMSSPNIAKPFGIGHLRSTIIGNSIAKISEFQGYKTVKINYLGDWGTQFGILIAGYKRFGSEKKLNKDPIKHLLEIYIKANKDESIKEEGKKWFKRLEQGDKISLSIWKNFKEKSLKEFNKIYKILNIDFDEISGESLYNKKMELTVQYLKKKNLLEKSEGAEIVNLEKYNLGVSLIKKSDGTTLYATRDITAALDRQKKFKFKRMFYEVGSEQKLYFKQLFKVLELMGYEWAKECIHVNHGLYLDKDGKKLATRKGKTVFMADILEETRSLAVKQIEKRGKLSKKDLEERAITIAIAAILYGDLKNNRSHDMVFDLQKFISFEGNTGPYLLYTYARAKSILRKAKYKSSFPKISSISEKEKALITLLANFPKTVQHAYNNLAPNLIANYSHDLAQKFNEFYHSERVISSDNEAFKLSLVSSFAQVLKNSLSLLGIQTLEKM